MNLTSEVKDGEFHYEIYLQIEHNGEIKNIGEIYVEKEVVKDVVSGSIVGGIL